MDLDEEQGCTVAKDDVGASQHAQFRAFDVDFHQIGQLPAAQGIQPPGRDLDFTPSNIGGCARGYLVQRMTEEPATYRCISDRQARTSVIISDRRVNDLEACLRLPLPCCGVPFKLSCTEGVGLHREDAATGQSQRSMPCELAEAGPKIHEKSHRAQQRGQRM